jgi:osmoprotectant transport system ATP-binding protein
VLAQFGTPEEILADPASDFVARFVGADRGLKRLALFRVRDLELSPVVTARVGESAAAARQRAAADPMQYLLLIDGDRRPLGWIAEQRIPRDGVLSESLATAMSPLLDRRTTLKDALSMLLDATVQAGIVVDHQRRVEGIVTVDAITTWARDNAVETSTLETRSA